MKKVISCMICALLLVGCMAGCGSTGGKSGSGNGIKIMMSLSQGDDFRNTIVEQAKKTAQEKGATLDVYDEDGSLESQVEHIKQAAKEKYDVILCGPVNADTALEIGLVNKILPPQEVNASALSLAKKMAAKPLASLLATKALLKKNQAALLQQVITDEAQTFGQMLGAPAAKEAMSAFMEKRKPDFSQL